MAQWTQESRAKSLINRSSIVTQALKLSEAKVGTEAYSELQSLESKAVAAGATFEKARAALTASQAKRNESENDLAALNSACLVICKARGVEAALYEELDKGDPLGLATHLEAPLTRIESVGPVIGEMLRQQRMMLGRCDEAVARDTAILRTAQGELSAALFKLEAGIASARALLAANDVAVKFPVKQRPPKRTKLETEPAVPAAINPVNPTVPEPPRAHGNNGATSTTQPANPELTMGGDGATN